MKRTVFVILFFCLTIFSVKAQEFHFIPKIGLNLSTITNLYDVNVRPGLNVGIAGEFLFTPNFAVEPGIYYSMQGVKSDLLVSEEPGGAKDGTLTWGADYLNIPVYAKWYTNLGGLYFFGGPQFGFKVKETNKIKLAGGGDYDDFEKDKSHFKVFDFGLGIGAGYLFSSGFLFSAGYTIGFINPLEIDYKKTSLNSVFQFNAGWRF